ncbi:hypothetical protein, partial [uncultured Hyphomicrobium sp.]|uniref:hypothetical protein n=1 Tax=uncultured Hyphomicrobium sp. TaxID=194373 RepID=UPI0025D97385
MEIGRPQNACQTCGFVNLANDGRQPLYWRTPVRAHAAQRNPLRGVIAAILLQLSQMVVALGG